MKREKRDDAYLWDMLDAAREARELISGLSYDDLMSRKVVRLALERVLEITGEAARNVSPRRRNRHAIPWQGPSACAMRLRTNTAKSTMSGSTVSQPRAFPS